MKTTLRTDITVGDICKGFQYNTLEERGLYGMNGQLIIQPEFQRNYIYTKGGKDKAVVDSLIKGYPLGLIYFVLNGEGKYEVLDGQQRITSFGRFMTGMLDIEGNNYTELFNKPYKFEGLPEALKEKIKNTPLTIYICEGTENEIRQWFSTVNIAGVPLNDQELRNAIYSGPFVTKAKEQFSNSQNANVQKWSHYLKGDIKRQEYLQTALKWVSNDNIDDYMREHRWDNNITELECHFNDVINWVTNTFTDIYPNMKGLPWGEYYDEYGHNGYDSEAVSAKMHELYGDPCVTDKKNICLYILGGCTDTKLLNIRVFDDKTKMTVYEMQTESAKENNISNCPLCAVGNNSNKDRIYEYTEMEADHVEAWSKGGDSSIENCTMLCQVHNRAKGNK